jgi:hypothetical protein
MTSFPGYVFLREGMSTDHPTPYLRASDADREATVERLREAAIEGRLDGDELEERLAAAYAARWISDLARLTADVTPPPPPPVPAPTGWPPVVRHTNGLAVASLIASLVWMWALGSLVAVICGHAALRQIKRSGGRQTGRGMAIAGLVIGYMGLAATVLFALGAWLS